MHSHKIKIAMFLSACAFLGSILLEMQHTAAPSINLLGYIGSQVEDVSRAVFQIATEDSVQTVNYENEQLATVASVLPETKVKQKELVTFPEQGCPFVAHGDDVVIDFQKTLKQYSHIAQGHYIVELAGEQKESSIRDRTFDGWYISLTDRESGETLKSGSARNIYNDERMVVELIDGVLAIEGGDYYTQVHFETDVRSVTVKPLCALLRYVEKDPELFPITETRLLEEPGAFNEDLKDKFDAHFEDFEKTYEEKTEAFTEEYEEKVETVTEGHEEKIETVSSELFKNNSTSLSNIATGSEPVIVKDTYTTGTNNQIYVEVSTYSVGIGNTDDTLMLPEELIQNREVIQKKIGDKKLFNFIQEKQQYVRDVVFPELVTEKQDIFGGISEEFDLTRKSIEQNLADIRASDTDTKEAFEAFRYEKKQELENGTDSDGDGVTDYDERFIYQSDPLNPFTSGTVLTDGERILLGLDPNRDDYRVFPVESAKRKAGPVTEHFRVHDIYYTTHDNQEKAIKIEGSTSPYSFVTLYLYSSPVIVTIRSDENGHFTYTLDKQLEDGTHELYVATVNSTGKILAQSDAHTFIKTAEAITYTPASVSNIEGPVDSALQKLVALSLLLTLLCAIGITVAIGYMKSESHESEKVEKERSYEE